MSGGYFTPGSPRTPCCTPPKHRLPGGHTTCLLHWKAGGTQRPGSGVGLLFFLGLHYRGFHTAGLNSSLFRDCWRTQDCPVTAELVTKASQLLS
ncbi:hypothetical protein LEMLEM_LOCUS157 [Lemmus lemmus]